MKTFLMRAMFSLVLLFASDFALADDNTNNNNNQNQNNTLTPEQIAALQDENKRLKEEIEKGKNKNKDKEDDDDDDGDLREKAAKDRRQKEERDAETKRLEGALTFNLAVDKLVEDNKDLLPAEVADVVKLAHKERYDSATAKASATKAAIIQCYFAVQANVDQLTVRQKETLDDYLRLTKTAKEDKAAHVYETIFEPALETARKVRKAEEVGRSRQGFGNETDVDKAYKDRLVRAARKNLLGEREQSK